jgi:hypothetical protein
VVTSCGEREREWGLISRGRGRGRGGIAGSSEMRRWFNLRTTIRSCGRRHADNDTRERRTIKPKRQISTFLYIYSTPHTLQNSPCSSSHLINRTNNQSETRSEISSPLSSFARSTSSPNPSSSQKDEDELDLPLRKVSFRKTSRRERDDRNEQELTDGDVGPTESFFHGGHLGR